MCLDELEAKQRKGVDILPREEEERSKEVKSFI